MKNLGEKLAAARNAMGFTLRDAADQTRLRTDIISNMESGEFNFKLPEIYKRGFLRIYAAFLKLNVDEIMAEYAALQASRRGDARKAKHILERIAPASPKDVEPPQSVDGRYESSEDESGGDISEDQMNYIKLGAVFVGVLLAVALIIFGVSSLVRPNAPEENPDINMASPAPASPAPRQQASPAAQPVKEYLLGISALRDTYINVYYPQDKSNPLYTGSLAAGDKKEFKYKTPLKIMTTDAQNIEVYRNGKKIDLSRGTGIQPSGICEFSVSARD